MLKTLLDIKEKSKNLTSFTLQTKKISNISDFYKSYYYNINIDKINVYNALFFNEYPPEYTLPKCPICNKDCKHVMGLRFNDTCGDSECVSKLKEKTNISKFGTKNPFSSNIIKEKIKQTNLKRYGTENPMQNNDIKEKVKRTILKEYKVSNISQSKEIQNKIKETNIKRYGTENPTQNSNIKEKIKQTNIKRYGTEHPTQNKEVKNKVKQTNLKRYGVEYPIQNKEIKEKVYQTNLKKYGFKHSSQSNIIKEKVKQTNLEKYGVEYSLQSKNVIAKSQMTNYTKYGAKYYTCTEEGKNKIKSTVLKRYGVEYAMYNDELKNKAILSNIRKYGVKHYTQTKKFKEKRIQTILKRYNVKSPIQNKNIKEKIRQTNLERYGVEYTSQNKNIKEKIRQTNLERYGVENPMQNNIITNKNKQTRKITKIKKYKNIIENKNLNLILTGDKCICKKCNKSFSIDGHFIKERFLYFNNIICPYCYPKTSIKTSNGQEEFIKFIKELLVDELILENERILDGKEIDIYIPSMKIGIEYNGLYWHSELYKDKYYHRDKSRLASEKGIRLIHIWEDDWLYKNEIVKSRIKNLLDKTEKRVYARKTIIKEVSYQDCKQFLNENHIQGCGVGNIRYGLFYKDDLVSVIQIDKSGLLSRFANKLNTNVIGGFSKLFKHCEKYIKYTFIDLDWSSENNIYSRYMKFDSYIEPTWYLINRDIRIHRRNFQKKKLLQMGLGSPEQTEHEITLSNKLYRIYNSGNIKYVNKENGE